MPKKRKTKLDDVFYLDESEKMPRGWKKTQWKCQRLLVALRREMVRIDREGDPKVAQQIRDEWAATAACCNVETGLPTHINPKDLHPMIRPPDAGGPSQPGGYKSKEHKALNGEIARRIANETGFHELDVQGIMKVFVEVMRDELLDGNDIMLAGFGRISLKVRRGGRVVRDLARPERKAWASPDSAIIKFVAGQDVKALLPRAVPALIKKGKWELSPKEKNRLRRYLGDDEYDKQVKSLGTKSKRPLSEKLQRAIERGEVDINGVKLNPPKDGESTQQ